VKISVLLPTRDRLELLKFAVASVLSQRYRDWEIVISDNASTEDVRGLVESLGDERIVLLRHERFLTVTENWNAALARSTGDYVIMLGDDDALLDGFMERVAALVQEHGNPDLIFCSAYFYAYPGAVPGFQDGFLKKDASPIFQRAVAGRLEKEEAMDYVRRSVGLRMDFPYNMQFSVFRRALCQKIPESVLFRSPYPDYYATNALFLYADRIIVEPEPLVIIGIAKKSYGYLHFNGQEAGGGAMHGTDHLFGEIPEVERVLLPGSRSTSCFLLAMEWLARTAPPGCRLKVDRARYRKMQMEHVCRRRFLLRSVDGVEYGGFLARLTMFERFGYRPMLYLGSLAMRLVGPRGLNFVKRLLGRQPPGMLLFNDPVIMPSGCHDIIAASRFIAGLRDRK